jgi:hypothetical protein
VHDDQPRAALGAGGKKVYGPLVPEPKIGDDRGKNDSVSEFKAFNAQRVKEAGHMLHSKIISTRIRSSNFHLLGGMGIWNLSESFLFPS